MRDLPDTSRPRRKKSGSRHVAVLVFTALVLGALLLAAAASLDGDGNDPAGGTEAVYAEGVEDIAASAADAPFPRTDASRFDAGTRAVRVYLRVEDVSPSKEMVATVERSGKTSLFSRLLGGSGVRAGDGGEGSLTVSENGASGVVSFVVRAADGDALPAGGYGVEVRFDAGSDGGGGRPVARKYFAVGDGQT